MVYIGVDDGTVTYSNGDNFLRVGVSRNLQKIIRVKDFDNGYVVFDGLYSTKNEIVEDYLDLMYGLEMIGLLNKKNDYFSGVRCEDICVVNH